MTNAAADNAAGFLSIYSRLYLAVLGVAAMVICRDNPVETNGMVFATFATLMATVIPFLVANTRYIRQNYVDSAPRGVVQMRVLGFDLVHFSCQAVCFLFLAYRLRDIEVFATVFTVLIFVDACWALMIWTFVQPGSSSTIRWALINFAHSLLLAALIVAPQAGVEPLAVGMAALALIRTAFDRALLWNVIYSPGGGAAQS